MLGRLILFESHEYNINQVLFDFHTVPTIAVRKLSEKKEKRIKERTGDSKLGSKLEIVFTIAAPALSCLLDEYKDCVVLQGLSYSVHKDL